MPPHRSHTLRLIAAALAAVLVLPSPAYALRVPEARDATGLEQELSQALGPKTGLEESDETKKRRGPGWYFNAAQRAMSAEQWEAAEAAWTTVLVLNRNPDDPRNAKIHMGRAKARMAQGNVRGAEEDCTEVIRLNGDGAFHNAPAFHLRADARTAQGQPLAAAHDWSAFIALLERRGRQFLDPNGRRDLETAYRQRGRLKLRWKDHVGAQHDMRAAIEINSQDVGAHITLAESASELGQHEDAKRSATTALEIAPDSVSALLALARAELGLGELAVASSHVLQAIALNPKPSAYAVLADVRERQGRVEEAQAARAEAVSRAASRRSSAATGGLEEPGAPRPRQQRNRAAPFTGSSISKELRALLAETPRPGKQWIPWSRDADRFFVGGATVRQGHVRAGQITWRLDETVTVKLTDEWNKTWTGQMVLASAALEVEVDAPAGGPSAEALGTGLEEPEGWVRGAAADVFFDEVAGGLEESGDDATVGAVVREMHALIDAGRWTDAFARLDQAVAEDPPHEIHYRVRQGRLLYDLGRIHEARALFAKILARQEDNVEALIGQAQCLKKFRNPHEAMDLLNYAISLQPMYARAWLTRGRLQTVLKKFPEAVTDAQRAQQLERDPASAAAWVAEADAWYARREIAKAAQALQVALEKDATQPAAQVLQVKVLEFLGRHEEATRLTMEALSRHRYNPRIAGSLMHIMEEYRHPETAAALADDVVRHQPADLMLWKAWADVVYDYGHRADAIAALTAYHQQFPHDASARAWLRAWTAAGGLEEPTAVPSARWTPESRQWAAMPSEEVARLVLAGVLDAVQQLSRPERRFLKAHAGIFVRTPDGYLRFVAERAQGATPIQVSKDSSGRLVLSWRAVAAFVNIPGAALYDRDDRWHQRVADTLAAAFQQPPKGSANGSLTAHRRIAHQLSTGYGIRGVRITEGGVVKEYDVPTLTHQFLRAVSTQLGEEGRLVRGGPPTTHRYHRRQIEDLLHLHHVADALPDDVVVNMRQRISETYGTVVPPKRAEGLAYDLWSLAAKLQASGVTVEIADPTPATRTGLEEDGRRAAVPDVLTWLKTILPGTVAVEAVPATLRGTSPGDHYLVVTPPAVVQVESLLRSRAKEVLVQALVMGTVRWPFIGVGKSGEVDDYRREILRWARRWGIVIPCSIHSHNHGTLWPSREDFHLHGVDARAGGPREFVYGARTGRLVEYGVNPRRRRGVPSTIRAQIWRDGAVEPDVYRLSETVRTPLTALSARALHWPLQDPRVHRIEMDDWKGRWVRWDRAVTVASVLEEAGLVQPAGGPSTKLRTGLEEGGRDRPSDGPHAQLGERYMTLHQWGLAEAQWTAALTSHEFPTPADAARYRFERAKARMARGNIRGAREDGEAILALNAPDDPHNGRVHYLLADALMAEGDDAVAETSWANAIRAFERQGPDSLREDSRRELARAYRELARLQWQRNDLDGAQRNALAAIAVDPKDVGACLVLAQVGLQLGQPGPARTFADAALTIAPGSVNAWLLRARADLALEEWRAAATAARRALALNPKKAYAHALLSQALARQGRSEEARTAHAQAVRYSKGPPRSRLAGGASTPLSTGLEEPEAEARERAIQEAVEGARRLREVTDQWLKVTVAVVDFSESQKPLRLIFSDPATYWAIPLAAKAGIPTIVLVPNGLVWNRVRQLWYAVKPQTSAFTILIEPTAVLDRYTRGYHVYEVGPATDGWFIRLSKPFQMVGVAMPSPEVLEPALGATRDYFRFA